MAIAFVLDEHFRGILWSAILDHNAQGLHPVDATRVGDPPDLPLMITDPGLLLWAEIEKRIVVTRDKNTMPGHLASHPGAGHSCPGVFIVRNHASLTEIVEFLVAVTYASDASEWQNQIRFIP
jgi:hypothetical protein